MKLKRNICLVLAASDAESNRRLAAESGEMADLFELRVDLMNAGQRREAVLRSFIGSAARPVVVTCRSAEEGGGFFDGDDEKKRIIDAALKSGCRFVDVEWDWWRRQPDAPALVPLDRLILSHHDLNRGPSAVEEVLQDMLRPGAHAVKVVTRADTFTDALRLVELNSHGERSGRRVSSFGVGNSALTSRILACVAGAYMTYVAPRGGPRPLPDVLLADEACSMFRLGGLPDPVKLLGILGHPVEHSLSPKMHNGVIRAIGERYLYVPFDCPDPEPVLDYVRRHDVRGLSVTIPHKVAVMPFLNRIDETARLTGAVNTIVRDGSILIGHNTDLLAARAILTEWGASGADRALLLGAGGAARAVLAALQERHIPTTVLNRGAERGRDVATRFGATYGGPLDDGPSRDFTLLINATPIGMEGEEHPWLPELTSRMSVLDLAYRPAGTPLEQKAGEAGCRVVSGLDFLTWQGAAQFALWTRRIIAPDLFREALLGGSHQGEGPTRV